MPADKDTLLGTLAVERGYLTQARLDETREAQERGAEAMGVRMPLAQILVTKGLLTKDQAQELLNAVAVQTGEARLVGGYEVVAPLGRGGMGAVYKAKKLDTGALVALKILPPSMATERLVARFKREAEITSRLDHEHIVRCVEFGQDPRRKCWFCALELIEGEDLGKRLKRTGAIPEGEAVGIAFQIAQALQHAHANGLVHRDVKPGNVMVTPDGTAKLLDLGLARPAGDDATRFTQDGLFVGSAYYASPEQGRGEADLDVRSDIYSLGCTLYHCVTGDPPFKGLPAAQVIQKHTADTVPWPAQVNPELSEGLCRIIARMMAKSAADRYQEPRELLADLDMLSSGGEPEVGEQALKASSVAVPVAVRRRVRERRPPGRRARPSRESARGQAGAVRVDARGRRRARAEDAAPAPGSVKKGPPVVVIAGAALAAAVVLGLGIFMLGGKEPDRRPPKAKTPKRQPGTTVRPPPPEPREAKRPEPEHKPPAEPVRKQAPHTEPKVEPFAKLHRESERRLARRAVSGPPPDAVEFGGHSYKLFMQKMSWHEAKRFCEERGGHLVTITSKEENRFVGGLAGDFRHWVWIGHTDEAREGDWQCVTGELLPSHFWRPGEPNDAGRLENCVALTHNDRRWVDYGADNLLGFVCEWKPGRPPPAAKPEARAPTKAVDVSALLSRFDSLMSKGDHAGARGYAEQEANDLPQSTQRTAGASKTSSETSVSSVADAVAVLRSAARVAEALETRPAAIRKGARSLVGKETDLRLRTRTMSGEIKRVTDDGLVVASVYYINRQRGERTATHPWDAFSSGQLDDLAEKGGWEVAPAERAVARAWVAFASGDLDAAESAAKEAGAHPLGEYLKGRVAEAKVEAALTEAIDKARGLMALRRWEKAAAALRDALASLSPGGGEGKGEGAGKPPLTPTLSPEGRGGPRAELVAEGRKLLAEAESHIPPPTVTLDLGGGVSMEFVYIKPGVFMMGGTVDVDPNHPWQAIEKPKHEVAITQGFYIGKYEVTQAQYEAVVGSNPSNRKEPNRPVERVTWHQAADFCRLATERTRKPFRLPTEAEWEYACRAGTTTRFSFGDSEGALGEYAYHDKNSGGQTHPVGEQKPNQWGLYDMHGNVWEWVADWYATDYYANSPRENPTGPDTGNRRLFRGGAWNDGGYFCRSAIRYHDTWGDPDDNRGFRAVVSAVPRGR